MAEKILLGRGKRLIEAPRQMLDAHLAHVPEHSKRRLAFMTSDHHSVRNYVVREMPRIGEAISEERIAEDLNLSVQLVHSILAELEENLFFLVRNAQEFVSWAFPMTVEKTPHRLSFHSGEQLYGAWGEDAIAAPFVQGKLRAEYLSVKIESECAHCGQPIRIKVDSDMNIGSIEKDSALLVFQPDVDWSEFKEPNICDAYWSNSVFFWSEEHAKIYRETVGQVDGIYLTLNQAAEIIPVGQSGLFGFFWCMLLTWV